MADRRSLIPNTGGGNHEQRAAGGADGGQQSTPGRTSCHRAGRHPRARCRPPASPASSPTSPASSPPPPRSMPRRSRRRCRSSALAAHAAARQAPADLGSSGRWASGWSPCPGPPPARQQSPIQIVVDSPRKYAGVRRVDVARKVLLWERWRLYPRAGSDDVVRLLVRRRARAGQVDERRPSRAGSGAAAARDRRGCYPANSLGLRCTCPADGEIAKDEWEPGSSSSSLRRRRTSSISAPAPRTPSRPSTISPGGNSSSASVGGGPRGGRPSSSLGRGLHLSSRVGLAWPLAIMVVHGNFVGDCGPWPFRWAAGRTSGLPLAGIWHNTCAKFWLRRRIPTGPR